MFLLVLSGDETLNETFSVAADLAFVTLLIKGQGTLYCATVLRPL